MTTLTPRRIRVAPFARLTPWPDLEGLQNRIDRFMGRAPTDPASHDEVTWTPAMDVQEKENEFLMTAELPGMTEEDITVDVEQNTLKIQGQKRFEREEAPEQNGRWHLVERSWGSFERSFTVPESVDASKVSATFENGVLTIHLPKRETSNARRVRINGGDDEC